MTEPSYTSYSVIYSFLLVLTSIAYAYSVDATDMMVAHGSESEYTTATTNGKVAAENVEELQVSASQEALAIDAHPAANEAHLTEAIDTATSSAPPVTKRDAMDSWFINIASLSNKDIANRFIIRARKKGIDAIQRPVLVDGRKYWRVSVKGFTSPGEARSYAILVKDLLGIDKVWIGKESG